MKAISLFAIGTIASGLFLTSCDSTEDRYLNLETGEKVELVKDDETGLMVDADSKKPVYLYVDTRTGDTIYGRTGKVINGHVVNVDGKWKYDNDVEVNRTSSATGAYEIKSGDYKKEVEKDGDIKIKDGDKKIKIDGETGERKVKNDD